MEAARLSEGAATSGDGFLYQCGCAAETVGQRFDRGVLVCPVHGQPVGPGPAADKPWRGRATIEFRLETRDHEEAALYVAAITEAILDDRRVGDVVSSVEDRT